MCVCVSRSCNNEPPVDNAKSMLIRAGFQLQGWHDLPHLPQSAARSARIAKIDFPKSIKVKIDFKSQFLIFLNLTNPSRPNNIVFLLLPAALGQICPWECRRQPEHPKHPILDFENQFSYKPISSNPNRSMEGQPEPPEQSEPPAFP